MATMTTQVAETIKKLRRAGLKRNEFTVRVARIHWHRSRFDGRKLYEYGDPIIHLSYCPHREIVKFIPAFIAEGLNVEHVVDENGQTRIVFVNYKGSDGEGKLEVTTIPRGGN